MRATLKFNPPKAKVKKGTDFEGISVKYYYWKHFIKVTLQLSYETQDALFY